MHTGMDIGTTEEAIAASGRGPLSSFAAPYAWGLGGFLIGAMFWHFIGVWSFFSTVVLNAPEPQISVVARPAVLPVTHPNCTVLALNRATGQTYSVPCAENVPVLEEARIGRQDFAAAQIRLGNRGL